jgi:subtilisin-like proprotein convertase family protein
MKKARLALALAAVALFALVMSADAVVVRSNSPGLAVSNTTNACSGTDGAGGVMDTIAYPETGTISDVNVRTEIDHTWRGDLQFDVQYSVGGGIVVLAADHDGSSDDYYVTFDDEAAMPCSTVCGTSGGTPPCSAAQPETCQPDNSLTAFDGLASPGTWTIRVCDDAGGDDGTLQLWEMAVNGQAGDGLPVELMGFKVE